MRVRISIVGPEVLLCRRFSMIFRRFSIFANESNLKKVKEFAKVENRQKGRKDLANEYFRADCIVIAFLRAFALKIN